MTLAQIVVEATRERPTEDRVGDLEGGRLGIGDDGNAAECTDDGLRRSTHGNEDHRAFFADVRSRPSGARPEKGDAAADAAAPHPFARWLRAMPIAVVIAGADDAYGCAMRRSISW